LPYSDQAQLLQAREGRQIGVVKGSVGHVEVFRMASVGTSIIGRPRRLSRHRRAHPATRTYTLRCEEPGNPISPGPLIHHSDAGSQYTSIRYTEHLDLEGIAPSIGTVGDAFDNALMESVNGLYKSECIRTTVFHPGPFRTLADVEFATAGWADWYNNRRLHGSLGMLTPVEFETLHYEALTQEPAPTKKRQRTWADSSARAGRRDRPARGRRSAGAVPGRRCPSAACRSRSRGRRSRRGCSGGRWRRWSSGASSH